jgi:hypothetical protein
MNEHQKNLLLEIKNDGRLLDQAKQKISAIESAIETHQLLITDIQPPQDTASELKNTYHNSLAENALGASHDVKSIEASIQKAYVSDDKANKQRTEDKKSAEATINGLDNLLAMENASLTRLTQEAQEKRLKLLKSLAHDRAERYEAKALEVVEDLRSLMAIDTAIGFLSPDYRMTSGLLSQGNFEVCLPSIKMGATVKHLNRGLDTMLVDSEKNIITDRGHSERVNEFMALFD